MSYRRPAGLRQANETNSDRGHCIVGVGFGRGLSNSGYDIAGVEVREMHYQCPIPYRRYHFTWWGQARDASSVGRESGHFRHRI